MAYPTEKGQKFVWLKNNKIYTVDGFFGTTGIEYDTLSEAQKNNSDFILIRIKETGGSITLEHSQIHEP